MKLYLANKFGLRAETKNAADALAAAGHEIVSSWVYGGEDGLTMEEIAVKDVEDVLAADAVVKFSQPFGTSHQGGGRHTEGGIALAAGKKLFVVGPLEQIFDWHPAVVNFPTLDLLIRYLQTRT